MKETESTRKGQSPNPKTSCLLRRSQGTVMGHPAATRPFSMEISVHHRHKTQCPSAHPAQPPSYTPYSSLFVPSTLPWAPTTQSPKETFLPFVKFLDVPASSVPSSLRCSATYALNTIICRLYLSGLSDRMHVSGGGSKKSRLCINRNQSNP